MIGWYLPMYIWYTSTVSLFSPSMIGSLAVTRLPDWPIYNTHLYIYKYISMITSTAVSCSHPFWLVRLRSPGSLIGWLCDYTSRVGVLVAPLTHLFVRLDRDLPLDPLPLADSQRLPKIKHGLFPVRILRERSRRESDRLVQLQKKTKQKAKQIKTKQTFHKKKTSMGSIAKTSMPCILYTGVVHTS